MNSELVKILEKKSTEDLFYLFKHNGAINFEKRLIAGKILKERGFDETKLSHEKNIIVNVLKDRIEKEGVLDFIKKKNAKKIRNRIFAGIGYLFFFIILGLKDFLLENKDVDWFYISIMLFLGFVFIVYKIVTYNKTFNSLISSDLDNNELLRLRLDLIEKEWHF